MHLDYSIKIIFDITIILFFAAILKAFFLKAKLPPVIGLIILGIFLGPSIFDLIEANHVIEWIAKVGVLLLLFEAGLGTNIKQIKHDSKQAFMPALGGVLLPLLMGTLFAYLYGYDFNHSIFIGAIFTATSVSVTVMTLLELNRLKGLEGRCIINAAIIDDVIGILIITFIFGLAVKDEASGLDASIVFSLGKIFLFFIFSVLIGLFIIKPLFANIRRILPKNPIIPIAMMFIFFYAYIAEISGIAAITGAYMAGLFLGQTEYREAINEGTSTVSKSFFTDVFFVSIGLGHNILDLDINLWFVTVFVVLAIVCKFLGSYIGARLTKFDGIRSLRVGVGMIPRGEVALIMALMGLSRNIVDKDTMSATILLILASALITPFLLKASFTRLKKETF